MENKNTKTWWQSILSFLVKFFLKRQKLRFCAVTTYNNPHGFALTFTISNKKSVYTVIDVPLTQEDLRLVRNWSAQAYKDILNKKQGR